MNKLIFTLILGLSISAQAQQTCESLLRLGRSLSGAEIDNVFAELKELRQQALNESDRTKSRILNNEYRKLKGNLERDLTPEIVREKLKNTNLQSNALPEKIAAEPDPAIRRFMVPPISKELGVMDGAFSSISPNAKYLVTRKRIAKDAFEFFVYERETGKLILKLENGNSMPSFKENEDVINYRFNKTLFSHNLVTGEKSILYRKLPAKKQYSLSNDNRYVAYISFGSLIIADLKQKTTKKIAIHKNMWAKFLRNFIYFDATKHETPSGVTLLGFSRFSYEIYVQSKKAGLISNSLYKYDIKNDKLELVEKNMDDFISESPTHILLSTVNAQHKWKYLLINKKTNERTELPDEGDIEYKSFSPDGKFIFASKKNQFIILSAEGATKLHSVSADVFEVRANESDPSQLITIPLSEEFNTYDVWEWK